MLLLLLGCMGRGGINLAPGEYLLPVDESRVELAASCLGADASVVEAGGMPALVVGDESFARAYYLVRAPEPSCADEVPTREFTVELVEVDINEALQAASLCLTESGSLVSDGTSVHGSDRFMEASRAESALRHYADTGKVTPCEKAPLVVAFD